MDLLLRIIDFLSLFAYDYILMNPGFEVEKGGTLSAEIINQENKKV